MILKEFDLLEKQVNLSDIDFLEIKLLKAKFYNYTAKYNKVLEIIDELDGQQKEKLDGFFHFNFIIEKLKVFEALDKLKESFVLIEKTNVNLNVFNENNDRKSQLSLANYFLVVGTIYQKDYKLVQALEYLNKSLDLFQRIDEDLGIAEVLYKIGLVHYLVKKYKESIKLFNESLEISKSIPVNMYTAWALAYKAMAFYYWGQKDEISPLISQSLEISKKFHNNHCEDFALSIISMYYKMIGELVKALKYDFKSLKLRKKRGNNIEIAFTLSGIARLYSRRGDLKKCEYYLNKAMEFPEVADHPLAAPLLLDIKAILLAEQGKFSLAIDHFKHAIILFEKTQDTIPKMRCFHYLISITLNINQEKQAYEFLEQIKRSTVSKADNPIINKYFLLEKAIIYKHSRDTYKELVSMKILKDLISSDNYYPEINIEAMLHYLEILIKELKNFRKPGTLPLIETINTKLLHLAKDQKKFTLISELYLFQANLEIFKLKYIKAMEYFTKALKNAKIIELELLIMKISNEYDNLLKNSPNLSKKQQQKVNFSNEMQIFEFQFLFSKMSRNLQINVSMMENVPFFLIIWSEIGSNLYEIIFNERNSGFNKEMKENLFREHKNSLKEQFISNPKIDRLKQDQITIVENNIKTIRFDYGFQGHSYHASRKLDLLIQNLKADDKLNYIFNENTISYISEEIKEYINEKVKKIFD